VPTEEKSTRWHIHIDMVLSTGVLVAVMSAAGAHSVVRDLKKLSEVAAQGLQTCAELDSTCLWVADSSLYTGRIRQWIEMDQITPP
jgi:hypothetical protein